MAVPTFTAGASLATSDGRVTRAFPIPRANAVGTSCDNQLLSDCRVGVAQDCAGLTGQAGAQCRAQGFAECRDAFGCPAVLRCSPGGPGSICCPATQTNCAGTCRSLASDPQNCGACGVVCAPGELCCSGACSNTASDPRNCGGCGNVCTGGKICQGGVCVCPPGLTDCGGVCRNLATDVQNCGGCGTVCTGGKICQGGVCVCPPGLTDCNGTCRDLASDPAACGGCTTICPTGNLCCGGVCRDVATDVQNCGSCNTVCPQSCSGVRRCNNGSCVSPAPITVFAEDNASSCVVGIFTPLAFTQSEATSCVQDQFPTLKVGVPTTTFFSAQVLCTGFQCRDVSGLSLSQSDWVSCVQFQNQGCTVSAGACP
jgi:hypothetical protein